MDVNSFILGYTEGKKKGGGSGDVGGGFDADTFFSTGLEEVTLETATALRSYAFYGATTLKRINLKNIETMGLFSIGNCGITSLTIPKSLKSASSAAVASCNYLTEVTFEGTPTGSIASMFNMCINLKTINVPWAQGEVAGAPWGATAATINYNYGG